MIEITTFNVETVWRFSEKIGGLNGKFPSLALNSLLIRLHSWISCARGRLEFQGKQKLFIGQIRINNNKSQKKANHEKNYLQIRLNLSKKDDQPIFDYFLEIKDDLGAKTYTEVARICIKKAYENWFEPKILKKKKK